MYIKCINERAKNQPEVLTPSPLPVFFQLFLTMKEIIAVFHLSLGMKKRTSGSWVKMCQDKKGMVCAAAEFFLIGAEDWV